LIDPQRIADKVVTRAAMFTASVRTLTRYGQSSARAATVTTKHRQQCGCLLLRRRRRSARPRRPTAARCALLLRATLRYADVCVRYLPQVTIRNILNFLEYDEGGRRGHSKKLFKKRTRLDVKKFSFSNRVVDEWNSLTDTCVNCITVNNFKNYNYIKRTRTENLWVLSCLRVGVIGGSLCLLMPSVSFDIGGFGEFGE